MSKRPPIAHDTRLAASTTSAAKAYPIGRERRVRRAGAGRSASSPVTMKTSMSPLSFTIASTSDPRSSERPALRRGLPTTIWLTLRSRASCSTALGMLAPETLAVSAPSCSASSKAAARWPRSAALRVGWPGLSTQATIHSARSRVASRRAARTSRPLSGFGRMQTRSRSAIGQVASIAWSRR